MHAKGLRLQEALDWIGNWHDRIVADFLDAKANLPSWGPAIDNQIARYGDGLAYVVRGVDSWSFESQRYFGTRGTEIQKTREIVMLPLVNRRVTGDCKWQERDASMQPIAALEIHNPKI